MSNEEKCKGTLKGRARDLVKGKVMLLFIYFSGVSGLGGKYLL